MIDQLTGIVLAGGRSRRFGSPKAMACWQGRRLIEEVVSDLCPLFSRILVMVKEPNEYRFLEGFDGVHVGKDIVRDLHPLGGIYSGLLACKTEHAFVSACDMPSLEPRLVERLYGVGKDHDAAIPVWNGIPQTLRGIYRRSCLGPIEEMLDKSRLSIQELLREVRTCFLREEEVKRIDPVGFSFVDIDTPVDFRRAKGSATKDHPFHAD